MDLKQLENDIIKYSKAYYDGNALISDAEFDALLDELKKIDPTNHLLTDIGHGYYQTDNNTVVHKFIIKRGLGKKFVDPDFKLPKGYLTPKYDGLSVTLYYEDGVFIQAVTRGDGTTGTDVTEKLKFHVPKNIDKRIKVITGEWLLSNENLKKFYPNSNSPRNIAGGALMKLTVDRKELSRFHFVAYRINKMDVASIKRDEILTVLRKNGFLTPDVKIYKNNADFTSLFNFYKTYSHKGFTFQYDGLVYDSGTEIDNEEIIYKEEIAYKIVSETADVVVTEVKWNHTNTNRYVPVIYFNPVQLSGALITKCTGHNAKCIIDNKITAGTKIKINRSGEVIPKLIGVYTDNGYIGVAKS